MRPLHSKIVKKKKRKKGSSLYFKLFMIFDTPVTLRFTLFT